MKSFLVACAFVCSFVAFAIFASRLNAQTADAAVSGQVTDPSGRVIPGVSVVLTNLNTNVLYTAQTNNEGIYRFAGVQPGIYRANVTKDGFASIVKGGIELHVQDQVSINFALRVGSVSEVVTVQAGAPMINTTDASVSTVVDQTYVKNMPLNGRSFQDLILLTPGIVTQTPQVVTGTSSVLGQQGEFSVNGQRTEANDYTVDGVSANVGSTSGTSMLLGAGPSGSLGASTALGTTQALVSVDELQELRVQSSTYSAEYGRNPGAQIAFQTKSGTNDWHGTAFDYLRNGFFDAQDWFNDYYRQPEPSLHQNDFGGTLGGPLRIPGLYSGKDKTFFFFSYEGLRLNAPQAATLNYVPDATMRANTPSPLNQVLNAFPVPNGPEVLCDPTSDPACPSDGQTHLAEFIGSGANPSSLDSTSIRFDHTVSGKLRLFFRFNNTTSSSTTRGTYFLNSFPTSVTSQGSTLRTYTAGASNVFTQQLSNDLRLNYSENYAAGASFFSPLAGSSPLDLQKLDGLSPGSSVVMNILDDTYYLAVNPYQQSVNQKQWNLVDTIDFVAGRHDLKFGIDYRRLAPFALRPNPVQVYNFGDRDSIEANSGDTSMFGNGPAYPLYKNFSAFAQDSWKVSQRLTLSLGLRWDVNPPPGVTQGSRPYTVQGSGPDTWAIAPLGTPLWHTAWYNFAPRLGVAYTIRNTPGWETVLRTGGGVFFDTGNQLGSIGFYYGPGFSSQSSVPPGTPIFPTPVPVPPIGDPFSPTSPYNGTVTGYYPHLQLPYTLQWNASLEQAVGQSQALTISFVGSHAARLLKADSYFPTANPNPNLNFNFISNGLTSDYDAMQVQFQRRLSHGLTALGSYTWSHCLDYGSLNNSIGYARENCDYDVRSNFTAAFSYDVPEIGHSGLAHALLHGWGLDERFLARTGFPVTLQGNYVFHTFNGQNFYQGLDLVPNEPIYIYGAQCAAIYAADFGNTLPCPGGRAINPDAFTLSTCSDCLGTAPRNFVRGFGAWQLNTAVRREFPLHERMKLQFRAEAFNIFNHPNFGGINPFWGNNTFGQAIATLAGSLGTLNPLYQMGGARSMQFALKLVF